MSTIGTKTEISASNFETDTEEIQIDSRIRTYHLMGSTRLGLTVLALAASISVLGVTANSIAVYNSTHVQDDFLLPLWPSNMDIRPTVAFVVCSVIVIMTNTMSLIASKTRIAQDRPGAVLAVTLAGPATALVAALIAMAFFYAVNASATNDSFQSWTCRWENVAMMTEPHFGSLCKQSKAGLGLAVFLVPLEAIVLGVTVYQMVLQRQLDQSTFAPERKTGNTSMSKKSDGLMEPKRALPC